VSGRALARELEIDKSTVVQGRRGRNLAPHGQLVAICVALDVPVSELVEEPARTESGSAEPSATTPELMGAS